jgi:FSR family fosmidomycin resistance protein-like MFS transporter
MPNDIAVDTPMATEKSRNQQGSSGLVLLSWAHFLNDGSANYLPGVLPAILISLHEPVAWAGVLMTALLIGQTLQPFTGIMSDRFGGKSIFILGLLGSAVGGGLLAFTHSLWLLILFLLMIGVGNSMFHPQALTLARNASKAGRQGTGMSFFLVGGELGRGLFPFLTSWIVVSIGLHNLWLTAVPALISVPFLFRKSPSLPPKTADRPKIHWRSHARGMAYLISFTSLRSVMMYGVVTFIPLLWHERGGSLLAGASIITTTLVVGIVGNMAGGHVADRFGRKMPLILSSIVTALLIPVMTMASGFWLWVVAGLVGIILFSSLPITLLIGQDMFPENRALGSGIALGLANGIGALLMLAVTPLVSHFGLTSTLDVIAVLGAVATVIAIVMPKSMMEA